MRAKMEQWVPRTTTCSVPREFREILGERIRKGKYKLEML